MTVPREQLQAYADGELPVEAARAVEQAVAADPELARQLAAERRLREALQGHFHAMAQEPVPDAWQAMIATSAKAADADDKIIDFSAERERRRARLAAPSWQFGMAIAASLVLGLMLGPILRGGSAVTERNGAMFASGPLAGNLETRLADAGPDRTGFRILATFRRSSGDYCRVFEDPTKAGIACRQQDGDWLLDRLQAVSGGAASGPYRQAGSAAATLLAQAQDMASGEPLDAAQETAAIKRNWAKGAR